jgi:hypothetical protein
MKVLHRFGVVCFWASCLIALAYPIIGALVVMDGEQATLWGTGQIGFYTLASIAIGSTIRYIFGWSAKDV